MTTAGRLLGLSLLLMGVAVSLGVVGPRTVDRLPHGFTRPVLALELVDNAADFELMKNEPSLEPKADHAGSLYELSTWIDFLFIACYAGLWTAIARRRSKTVALLGTTLVLVGALADISEDVGILIGLRAAAVSLGIAKWVSTSALIKWGALGAAFLGLAESFRPTWPARGFWEWWQGVIALAYVWAGLLCLVGVFGSHPLIESATPALTLATLMQTVLFGRQWRQQNVQSRRPS